MPSNEQNTGLTIQGFQSNKDIYRHLISERTPGIVGIQTHKSQTKFKFISCSRESWKTTFQESKVNLFFFFEVNSSKYKGVLDGDSGLGRETLGHPDWKGSHWCCRRTSHRAHLPIQEPSNAKISSWKCQMKSREISTNSGQIPVQEEDERG